VRTKNRRVPTDEERIRIGRRLKRLRNEQGLKQRHIVQKSGLSTGTVQAIEYGKTRVLLENIDKYAAAVGTTTQHVLHPETVPPPSEWLRDLNKEHLAIARLYMKAYRTVRAAVEVLLGDEAVVETATDIAEVVLALKGAADRDPEIVSWTEFLILDRGDLLVALAKRLNADPMFEQGLRDRLDEATGKTK
jgi:transcriptional regulator with XRE-family HTH domain